MENPTILDEYKEKIDSIIFDKYQSMYEDITNNNLNNPNLTRLSIDVNIKAIDTDELKSTLSAILIKHYNKKLKEIASSNNIPYQEKSFKIRKIRTDIIPRLKKGEIVSINL
jgi:DNA primase